MMVYFLGSIALLFTKKFPKHYLFNDYNILRTGWKIWLSSGLYLGKQFA